MKPEFVTIQAGGLKWTVRKDLQIDRRVLENPDLCFSQPDAIIKNSATVTIARHAKGARPSSGAAMSSVRNARHSSGGSDQANVAAPEDERTPVMPALIVRRLNYGKRPHQVRDVFRPSRARQAFRRGLLLEAAGIATPRVIAVAEKRRVRWPVRAYLITEEVSGAQTLAHFVWKGKRMPPQTIRVIASLLARLHDSGFSHRDLKPSNILIDENLKPFLIDLDAVRAFKRLPSSRARRDVLRFAQGMAALPAASPRALVRLLHHYCRARNIENWRAWWDEIAPQVQKVKVTAAKPNRGTRKAELSR